MKNKLFRPLRDGEGEEYLMEKQQYIMALDQGTTSSRCIIFNKQGEIVSVSQKEFKQIYPKAGWVEHDPMEIWGTQAGVAREALAGAGLYGTDLAAVGIKIGRAHV